MELLIHYLLLVAALIAGFLCAGWLIDRFTGGYKRRGNILLIEEQIRKYPEEKLLQEVAQEWERKTQELTKQQDLKTLSAASTTADSRTPTGSSTRSGPSRT